MHHDEANQAVKFGALLERGEYRYDAHDHHGPTLYYLTLPSAWLRGQHDARVPRRSDAPRRAGGVRRRDDPAAAAAVSAGIGRTAVAAAAMLMALSPAMVFYSRMFIQESLFACFTLAFVIAVGRVATGGGPRVVGAGGRGRGPGRRDQGDVGHRAARRAGGLRDRLVVARVGRARGARWPTAAGGGRPLASLAAAAAVAALFYSSFFAAPAGILEPFPRRRHLPRPRDQSRQPRASVALLPRPARLLVVRRPATWSEGLVLVLAVVGAATAWRRLPTAQSRARRSGRAISPATPPSRRRSSPLIPYKTPWNLLPFYVVAIVARRRRVRGARRRRRASRAVRSALAAALAIASGHLGWQAWRASVTYAAGPAQSRTSTPRRSPTPSAWRRASAIWRRCIPTARACRCR